MGVYAKDHIVRCPRCAEQFRDYLRANKVTLSELGRSAWADVKPFNIWLPADPLKKSGQKTGAKMATAPTSTDDALLYYYTFRFMTHATAQVFPEAAKQFKASGIPLYAMQGPTPSWDGSSLDWHEF